ncbi:uncharacterized protein N7473_001677 [Penicillium subrubescens]|uniref:HTH CENPB-type domain-containing protein n=1 Tax=Penicillium subrubescens TaxID=1316194 RepID=A0A1Q5UBQ1_9EURO|nr:uncharacterized protein N7473_001677 [Penicillium subrubescens]KAJ5904761.1 hypothetical protein N7473_001677 [Penicillium subrubescens]OKP09889.1 hypothetical protein PENSUB_4720 [Penicillium subrubescens]
MSPTHQHQRRTSYATRSRSTGIPASTLWRRANNKPSIVDKAANQQYLTPQEEQALVEYVLRLANNGYPLPVKFLRSLALVIARQRSSTFQIIDPSLEIRPPGKNWPQGFYLRHPQLKARRLRAIDWKRDDRQIEEKVQHWFAVIGCELADPAILRENVYNMDETGVLLSVLNSLKVLVGKDDLRKHRGTTVKRTLVTAVECISADGRSLHPLIIWPASTHRGSWTTHATPGWHFACSKTGYTNTEISLYWIEHVFNPQTRERAGDRPRLLICDGFGTHESLEVMKFCFANRIILCRLPSHTSHKLQPCDVGVFGPLKTAYRAQVEQACRAGVGTIGKPHFTYLYDRARKEALTPRNIRSAWSKSGLFPFDPSRVLREFEATQPEKQIVVPVDPATVSSNLCCTPNTSDYFALLRREVEQDTQNLDSVCKHRLQTLSRAAEKVFAERALLLEENRILFEQNNEKSCRQSTGQTVVGHAKVMSYEDIVEAQKKRDMTVAKKGPTRKKRSKAGDKLLTKMEEKRKAEQEIQAWNISDYCSVLDL